MIDNILDISLIEAGRVALTPEWIHLPTLITELTDLVSPIFTEKGLYLRFDPSESAAAWIFSDREKLRQILKNFLSNAAKFTERGGVEIRLEPSDEAARPIAIHVLDTGIGIPPDKQGVIFEAFQQADGSTRRRYGGTGLGLSISRELADLLGGAIRVQSAEGAGACFTLSLPQEVAIDRATRTDETRTTETEAVAQVTIPPPRIEAASPDADAPQMARQWVLVVERDVESLLVTTSVVESLGLRVQTAADAEEAIETLREEGPCSLLLLAALVSAEKTCDTISQIRHESPELRIPVLVMGDCEDHPWQGLCVTTGADGAVSKPIKRSELEAWLLELLGRRPAHTGQLATPSPSLI